MRTEDALASIAGGKARIVDISSIAHAPSGAGSGNSSHKVAASAKYEPSVSLG